MSEVGERLLAFPAPVERRFSGMGERADDVPAERERVKLLVELVEERFSGSWEKLEALVELLHPGKPRFAGMPLFRDVLS